VPFGAADGRITSVDGTYIPGLRLAGEFYTEAVRPLLDAEFPALPHAAALLGPGSEVLGFDTERSTDHDWGPRLQLFLTPNDSARHAGAITTLLTERLPGTFRGYRVAFGVTGNLEVRHRVQVTELGAWLTGQLGFDPRAGVAVRDWLAVPSQRLAEVTAGAVFHDGPGELSRARTRLEWYPGDVWRYVLGCQWQRISQEEAFPGRCAEVGDELGSAVVTARLARDLMRLWLLMNRRYPPYSKWLGTAFARLPGTGPLTASLTAALAATQWHHREHHLVQAYTTVAESHNALGLTEPLAPEPRRYYDRPFLVLDAGRFVTALTETITDPVVRRLPPIGAADQFMDSTDALGELRYPRAVITAG
jgi:Domain of unknown function (DUF4037)